MSQQVDPQPRPRTSRRRALVAVASVLTLVLVVAAGGGWWWASHRDTPEKSVRAYLTALRDGNSTNALKSSEVVVDTTFLTDAVLRSQRETNRGVGQIISVDGAKATFMLAGERRTVEYPTNQSTGEIRFPTSVVVEIRSVVPVTLEGRPAAGRIHVFPGRYELKSVSENVVVTGNFDAVDPLQPLTVIPSVALSPQGVEAARKAAAADLARCVAAKQLAPTGCPFKLQQPANGTIDEATITYAVANGDPFKGVQFAWDQQSSRAAADIGLTIDFKGAGAMKDGTGGGAVAQRLAISAKVYVDVTGGRKTVTWTTA